MSQTYRLTPDMSVHGVVNTKIDFRYDHVHFTAMLHTPRKIVNGAKQTPRNERGGPVPDDFARFTLDPAQDQTLAVLTDYFDSIRRNHRYNNNQYVNLLRSYVQSLPYEYDIEASRRQYYPIETASLGTGVCSDKSLLLCALLACSDFAAALVNFPKKNHAMAGIKISDVSKSFRQSGYFLIETTNTSGIIAELPDEENNAEFHFLPIGSGKKVYEV